MEEGGEIQLRAKTLIVSLAACKNIDIDQTFLPVLPEAG